MILGYRHMNVISSVLLLTALVLIFVLWEHDTHNPDTACCKSGLFNSPYSPPKGMGGGDPTK